MQDVGAHVEARGPVGEQTIERGGQHVLPRVLLHVVEAAGPVDLAGDGRLLLEWCSHDMDDLAVRVDNVEDLDPGEASGVEGLAARRWVERRAVEHDCRSAFELERTPNDGIEDGTGRVGVVDSISHGIRVRNQLIRISPDQLTLNPDSRILIPTSSPPPADRSRRSIRLLARDDSRCRRRASR